MQMWQQKQKNNRKKLIEKKTYTCGTEASFLRVAGFFLVLDFLAEWGTFFFFAAAAAGDVVLPPRVLGIFK